MDDELRAFARDYHLFNATFGADGANDTVAVAATRRLMNLLLRMHVRAAADRLYGRGPPPMPDAPDC